MEKKYVKEFQVLWADIDANRHMRHSAYNDYAAQVRLGFFADHGFPVEKLEQLQIGPILFREETVFLREVPMNEIIKVDLHLAAMRADGSRWKIVHNIYRSDAVHSAVITVEGAWLDLVKRKLSIPPTEIMGMIDNMPKLATFEVLPEKSK
jgi:acyl-CoA thioester hydrolase